jgi:aminoglycoside phosphotransferase
MTVAAAPPLGLAPDRVLPQRDVLLDGDEMRARLTRLLGLSATPITAYRRGRVKYRIGESLRVVHHLEVGADSVLVSSRTFPAGASDAVFRQALSAARPSGRLRGVAHDAELETVFWTFPNDRKLARLWALDPESGALPTLAGGPVERTALTAYAPEKAAIVSCWGPPAPASAPSPIAYAKVYADTGDAAWAQHVHCALGHLIGTGHPLLRLPASLGLAGAHGIHVVEALAGRRVDTLRGAALTRAMGSLGAAVATLHTQPPVAGAGGRVRFLRLAPERQRRAAELIARARPDVASVATALADRLQARAPAPDADPVCLHGDVHRKNAIEHRGRIALIDLDQVSAGPPAAEVGSILAGVRYHALVAGRTDLAAPWQDAFLAGYGGVRPVPDALAVRWHIAAALLSERALRAVNRVRAEGLIQLGTVLGQAAAILAGEAA